MRKYLFLLIGFCFTVLSLQSLASGKQVQKTLPNRKIAAVHKINGSTFGADTGKWEIRDYDRSVTIEAGILTRELIISDSLFASAGLFVRHNNLIRTPAEEFSVTFVKTFPNKEPGEWFESDPVFLYAFSGKSYPTVSAVLTTLDRCVEDDFKEFLNERILRPVNQNRRIAPIFCTWTNYSAAINDSDMRIACRYCFSDRVVQWRK